MKRQQDSGRSDSDVLAEAAALYGLTESDLHDAIMARRPVRALCAAVDLAILRGQLDPRSLIADARLVVSDPDCPGDEPELLRRIACTRPASQRATVAAAHGEDNFR